MLSGMTATSIGPDSNQVLQALSNLKWLCVMDALPDHELGVLARARHRPEHGPDRGVHAPGHALDREGRVVHQQRSLGAVEGAGAAARGRCRARPLDPRRAVPAGARPLPASRAAAFPDADHGAHPPYSRSAQAATWTRSPRRSTARTSPPGSAWRRSPTPEGRRHHDRRRLDLHRALPGERQPDQAPRRRPGPDEERPDRAWASTRTGRGAGQLNRRVLYNRASADPQGRPWDPTRPGIQWDAATGSGSATCPTTRHGRTRPSPAPRCRSS